MTEKPIGIVLPSWNPDEPRFIVKTYKYGSDDRQFKNSKCVFNQRLGFAYSVDEIVEVLNILGDENEQLKQFIKELTSRDGKIWLSGGYVYDVKKVLKDGDNDA